MAIDGQRSPASIPASAAAPAMATEEGGRPYIECRDLFKIFKLAELEVVALRGVDLEVSPRGNYRHRGGQRQRKDHPS